MNATFYDYISVCSRGRQELYGGDRMSRKNKRRPPVRTGHDDRAKERQGSASTAQHSAAPKGSEPSAPDGLSGNWS